MRKKNLLSILTVLSLFLLTACGDGDIPLMSLVQGEPIEKPAQVIVEPLGTASPESVKVTEIQALEQKYAEGAFSAVDYKVLAKYYQEDNQYKEARDAFEICYQMSEDVEAYEALQGLTVNAAEEEAMAEQLDLLITNLNTPEYANESISMLFTQEWFAAMMPQLGVGKRSYYREVNGTILYLEVGYNEQNQKYTSIWKKTGDKVQVILQTPDSLQSVNTGVQEGKYQGVFESWICIASTGDVFHEMGTFDQGKLVGDYTAGVKWGKASADIMALWTMREDLEMDVYLGSFDGNGRTTIFQPEEALQNVTNGVQDSDSVVYAYGEGTKNYLFMNLPADTVFNNQVIGLSDYPAFEAYEPAETSNIAIDLTNRKIALSDLQVRIYNSNIEVFDGTNWIIMGSVEEFAQQDSYVKDNSENSDTDKTVANNAYTGRGAGEVNGEVDWTQLPEIPTATPEPTESPEATATPKPTATVKPTATPKPTATVKPTATPKPTATVRPTTAPVVTQAPTATPAPTQAPTATPAPTQAPTATPAPTQAPTATPAPTQAPTATPAPTQAPTATPAPTQTPTPEPTQAPSGGDTDVEWTPDMM